MATCWVEGETMIDEVPTLAGIECIFQIILNYALRFAGLAVFIMLIVGGFKYITAGGDPKKTEEANHTLTYAVFGLALIIISWFVLLLIKNFTGIDVTVFTLIP